MNNNTFNFSNVQSSLTAQTNEFAKAFAAHSTKIGKAQQDWFQTQSDVFKNQFEQVTTSKDLPGSAQVFQNSLHPVAESMIKHAQELFNLTLAAQKELASKVQDTYQVFAVEANTAVETSVKQLPNQGEPFVSLAKNATQTMVGALEQVADQVKTAQANYEAQVAKLFEQALTTVASPALKAKATTAAK